MIGRGHLNKNRVLVKGKNGEREWYERCSAWMEQGRYSAAQFI